MIHWSTAHISTLLTHTDGWWCPLPTSMSCLCSLSAIFQWYKTVPTQERFATSLPLVCQHYANLDQTWRRQAVIIPALWEIPTLKVWTRTRTQKRTCVWETQCVQSASNASTISNDFTHTRSSVTANPYFTAPTTHDRQPSSFWKAWADYSNQPGVKTQIGAEWPQLF